MRKVPLLPVAVLAAVTLAGCTSSAEPGGAAGEPGTAEFGHVHGIDVNPADDRLYVATHTGVFRHTDDGFERIADRWQDTMSFTIVGPDHFLASGHPDTREDKPVHLGLTESTDAAKTWRPLSLEGEADFHALEAEGDRVYGLDSQTGRLLVTTDGRAWQSLGQLPAVDMAADPSDPETLLATDPRGALVRLTAGDPPSLVDGAPALVVLDWETSDLLVGVGPDGEVHRSTDGGSTWEEVSSLPAAPHALAVTEERWYVATESGLYESEDGGKTWSELAG